MDNHGPPPHPGVCALVEGSSRGAVYEQALEATFSPLSLTAWRARARILDSWSTLQQR
jgi:hypothetical protein